ncbi:MAG: hypothetical protein RLZ10_2623, partial [Bacteroidota bacterium]
PGDGTRTPPVTINNPDITVLRANDTSFMGYDQDSGPYFIDVSTWTLPTTAGLDTYTDQLILSNLAVKPNPSWTITNVTISIRKVASDDGSGTFARAFDALFRMQISAPGAGTFTLPRQEKLGIWPQTYTTYTYDLSFGLTATQLTSLYNPLTWAASRTALAFAAGFRLSSTAKNSFSWGLDSVLVTFTYILPSITPYPIAGVLMSNFVHTLRSQPVTINPYSVKTIEAVNLQIPAPGTKIAPVSNIRPFGQIAQESLGRHRINPGNVNITNFPIVTLEKLGFNRITSLVNLQDRSIKSLETLGLHRLYAQSFVNPYSVNTSEQFGFDTLYSQAFIQPYGIKTLDILGRNTLYSQAFINPYSQISDEKLGLNNLYAQAYIYPHSINSEEKLGLHTLYSQAFIIPYPINTVEKTGLHRLNSEAFIRPYPITTEEKLRLHSLLYGSYIYPYSITTTEILGLHELQRQVRTLSFLNEVHYPSYEMGYFDCVAISRDINNDPYYDMSFGSLNTDYMFSINNMNLNYKQNSNFEKRLAGEGASPTTFKIDKRDYSFDFTMPIKIESWGDVDPGFAALYDYCIQGYKGSTNNFVGRILSDNMNSAIGSTNRFVIDNISDFMSLGTGYNAYIKSDDNSETTETLVVSSIDKATKTVIFTTSTAYSHTPYKSYLWANGTNPNSNREPSFSMFSAKEGLFSGCLIDSLTLRLVPGENIIANVGIKFTDLDRKYQKNFFNNFDTIMSNINDRKPNYLLNSTLVSVSNSQTSTSNNTFNLGDAKTSKLFHGYQEYDLRDFEIVEMTIDFKNNLEPVYSLNSKSSDTTENFNKNLQPYAYYSNGRTISGTIKYNSPMKPWLLAERLSGPSNVNKSGIKFDFGPFTLELPQVTWSPDSTNSSVDSVQSHSISWSVVVDTLSYDPYPQPTGEL